MKLSIIILNYKTRGLLKQLLRGLGGLTLPFSFETIVVDNNSSDGSVEMVREEFSSMIMIASPVNGGFAAGMNLGMAKATGEYYLLMNTDIAILSNAIEVMVCYMDEHKTVGLAGPRLINPDGSVQTSCRRFPTPGVILYRRTFFGLLPSAKRATRSFLMLDTDHTVNRPVDWVLGACMIVRRSCAETVGTMDDRFFLYFEDVDWSRRFWHAGCHVHYIADAEMVHYHERASAEHPGFKGVLSYATRVHIKSGIKYFAKYYGAHDHPPIPPSSQ